MTNWCIIGAMSALLLVFLVPVAGRRRILREDLDLIVFCGVLGPIGLFIALWVCKQSITQGLADRRSGEVNYER